MQYWDTFLQHGGWLTASGLNAFPLMKPLNESFLFHVENEHIYEDQVITKQCNNCENEFILPGLFHSLHLMPHLKPGVQFWTSAGKQYFSLSTKHLLIEYLAEERCCIASVQSSAKCKSSYFVVYNPTSSRRHFYIVSMFNWLVCVNTHSAVECCSSRRCVIFFVFFKSRFQSHDCIYPKNTCTVCSLLKTPGRGKCTVHYF